MASIIAARAPYLGDNARITQIRADNVDDTIFDELALDRMLERRVNYEYICQDPCTGEIDPELGQTSDEIVGPRAQFVRWRLIGVDYEFMPSQLPISPPTPRRIPQ